MVLFKHIKRHSIQWQIKFLVQFNLLIFMIQFNTWNIDSIQYLEYWFNPIPRILIQSNTSNNDSIQYLEYWFNPIPRILIQSNTSNNDSIQYLEYWCNHLEYWCNLPGPSAANRNESNWALESTENMAGEGELDLEVEFPKFLADVLDNNTVFNRLVRFFSYHDANKPKFC